MSDACKTPSQQQGFRVEPFIAQARDKGVGDETIWHMLQAFGWKDREIARIFAARVFELSIPAISRKGGSREAFFHLSFFTCIYVATVSLVVMLFNLVDAYLPEPTDAYWELDWTRSTVRSSLSTLIVFFPLAILFGWLINRESKIESIMAGSLIERWLTYLSLFVVVMTILIDASTLIYFFLEGEMTLRILIKSSILLIVVGSVSIYLWTGTKRWAKQPISTATIE